MSRGRRSERSEEGTPGEPQAPSRGRRSERSEEGTPGEPQAPSRGRRSERSEEGTPGEPQAPSPTETPASTGDVRLLLLADTHVPRRARDLPAAVWEEVDRADVVVHAGDWVDVALLDALEARSRRLVACYGNNDGPPLRERLPLVAHADVGGLRLAVVHETGQAAGREARCDAAHPGPDVLVFGHSHIPWDSVTPAGMRLLNPGSPTDRRRQPACTYATAVVRDGALADVALHRLPPR